METNLQTQWSWDIIKQHNSLTDAWIVLDDKVYDISTFLKSHPGGKKVLEPYLAKDISLAFRGKRQDGIKGPVHAHRESTISLIQNNFIGYVEGSKTVEALDLKPPSSCIDTTKPILNQIVKLGAKYYDVIDSPLHLHDSARVFNYGLFGNFAEFCSRNKWTMVPALWIPIISTLLYYGVTNSLISNADLYLTTIQTMIIWIWGFLVWTNLEWTLHRWIFHVEHWVQYDFFKHPLFINAHFLLHGIHHLLPADPYRLVMPPVNSFVIITPISMFWRLFLSKAIWGVFFSGLLSGYICYDLTHYFLHHGGTDISYFQNLRTHHMVHHYTNVDEGYGVSSKLWDYILGDLGMRKNIITARLGRWSIKGNKPSDEVPLFKYHVAICITLSTVIPYILGHYFTTSNIANMGITA